VMKAIAKHRDIGLEAFHRRYEFGRARRYELVVEGTLRGPDRRLGRELVDDRPPASLVPSTIGPGCDIFGSSAAGDCQPGRPSATGWINEPVFFGSIERMTLRRDVKMARTVLSGRAAGTGWRGSARTSWRQCPDGL
jgi:hypothetical protein